MQKLEIRSRMKAWFYSEPMLASLENIKPSDIREAYEDEFGKPLGACAKCGEFAHDRHGLSFDIPKGRTSGYTDNGAINFCSQSCAIDLGADFTIRHLLDR